MKYLNHCSIIFSFSFCNLNVFSPLHLMEKTLLMFCFNTVLRFNIVLQIQISLNLWERWLLSLRVSKMRAGTHAFSQSKLLPFFWVNCLQDYFSLPLFEGLYPCNSVCVKNVSMQFSFLSPLTFLYLGKQCLLFFSRLSKKKKTNGFLKVIFWSS